MWCGGGGSIPHSELIGCQTSELLLGLRLLPPVEGESSQVEMGKPL